MKKPIESENNIAMKIFDHVCGELTICLFISRDEVRIIFLKILPKNNRLLKMTLRSYFFHELHNSGFFCLHSLVYACLHGLKEGIDV